LQQSGIAIRKEAANEQATGQKYLHSISASLDSNLIAKAICTTTTSEIMIRRRGGTSKVIQLA